MKQRSESCGDSSAPPQSSHKSRRVSAQLTFARLQVQIDEPKTAQDVLMGIIRGSMEVEGLCQTVLSIKGPIRWLAADQGAKVALPSSIEAMAQCLPVRFLSIWLRSSNTLIAPQSRTTHPSISSSQVRGTTGL